MLIIMRIILCLGVSNLSPRVMYLVQRCILANAKMVLFLLLLFQVIELLTLYNYNNYYTIIMCIGLYQILEMTEDT